MKKLFLLLIIAFSLSGCAYWQASGNDPAAMRHAEESFKKGSALGSLAGAAQGPAGAAAGGFGGGAIAYVITRLMDGYKITRKKKEEENGTNPR